MGIEFDLEMRDEDQWGYECDEVKKMKMKKGHEEDDDFEKWVVEFVVVVVVVVNHWIFL